jgi:hypothetical protein
MNYQLSIINYQLSIINYQLSIINYQCQEIKTYILIPLAPSKRIGKTTTQYPSSPSLRKISRLK